MVGCARGVVKSTKPVLELGDRPDVGSSTAKKRAEEFRRIADILEGYSNFMSLLGWLLQKPLAPFESALVKPLQSLAGEETGWLCQPQ